MSREQSIIFSSNEKYINYTLKVTLLQKIVLQ